MAVHCVFRLGEPLAKVHPWPPMLHPAVQEWLKTSCSGKWCVKYDQEVVSDPAKFGGMAHRVEFQLLRFGKLADAIAFNGHFKDKTQAQLDEEMTYF